MNRIASLAVAVAVATAATPVLAQPAPPRAAVADGPADGLSPQERDALAAAEQLAADAAQRLEQWIATPPMTEDRLFARLYFPIPNTRPQKYSTPYDSLADRALVTLEDQTLARSSAFQYAIVTDSNAYVPAHNSRFAQPLTGDVHQDYVNNRTKRILGDLPSLLAARSEARYLIQRTRLETGDAISDVSVPIVVRGKHWGCARIGFRRTE